MPFHEHDGLRVYRFSSLPGSKVVHGVFTRHGGASRGPWTSLNLGSTVGDKPGNVEENHNRLLGALDRTRESCFDLWQVHSADVLVASEPRTGPPYPRADGAITDNPQVTLLLRFADCVPILLYDPEHEALGVMHAGWRGTIRGVATEAVRSLRETYGTSPATLSVALGPSIQKHHYPVGPEVISALRKSFGSEAREHYERVNGSYHLDLQSANVSLLRQAGVRHIETVPFCTACQTEDWYSHRGEGPRTGRFGVVAALRA